MDDGKQGAGTESTLAAELPMDADTPPAADRAPRQEQGRPRGYGRFSDESALRRFGRYIVLGTLGQGGMGTVLKGYDEQLDRQVAIKVLRGQISAGHTARLRREAQAMAKLSHPNVVQVYEVGELEGQVFVAMELVRGQSLDRWQRERDEPRGWKECVEVYLQAGRGLAAAHAKGLVHRDFKPHNAILDEEGRCRVLDFGLARRGEDDQEYSDVGAVPTEVERARADNHEVVPLDQSLTQTGAVLGTPAYMPLEQMNGKEADARSDQFSLCVALYEAVYGQRPYEGDTLVELMVALHHDKVRPPPRSSTVPTTLRTVLLRGLAADPDERWPSMTALVGELERLVTPRASRWAAGVGVTLAAVAGAVALWQWSQLSDQEVEITDTREQLAARVEELRVERDKVAVQLAAQKGLRATMLAEDPDQAMDAVRLAVEAAGDLDPNRESVPAAVFEGLTHALAGVHGGFALREHTNQVHAVAVSADGQHIATTSRDQTVRLWDTRSGAPAGSLDDHEGTVWDVAFSPDGAWLVTGSTDKTVRLWDRATGRPLDTWAHPQLVRSVAVSPDGQRVAFASGNAAWVWHPGVDDVVAPLVGHSGRVREVVFSPGGQRIATASEDGTVRLWDMNTAHTTTLVEGHTDKVFAVAFSPDGTRIASGGRDHTVRVWNAATAEPEATLKPHEVVYAVAFSPDGTQLVAGTFDDGRAHLWDLGTERRLDTFHHDDAVFGVAFTPDGQRLVTASRDFTAHVWDLGTMRTASGDALVALQHERRVDAVALSPDGTRIATGSGDGNTRLWDTDSGALLATLQGHPLDVLDVAFSADGRQLASSSWDGSVRVWQIPSGTLVQTLAEHTEPVRTVAFAPDGTQLVTASRDGTARVWDITTGTRTHMIEHDGPLVRAVLSPDGERLVTVGADASAKEWSITTGEPLSALPIDGPVTAVAFSPDGSRIAASRSSGEVRTWSTTTGEELAVFTGHTAAVLEMVFSADGARLATASKDGTARVWDAVTGTQHTALPHRGPVSHVAFSADGSQLATTSGDRQARLWSLKVDAWLPWGCAVLADRQGHNEATRQACSHATTTRPPTERAPRARPEPVVVAPDPARPEPKSITVHGIELVLVPGGTFTMGSPSTSPGEGHEEKPQNEVTLDSFYLAKTEVTNAQYALFREFNPEVPEPPLWRSEHYNQPQQPVVGITWHEAKAYCDWAGLVLPTEAQWEYAARATTSTAFWFGDEFEDLPRFGWYDANTGYQARGPDGARPHSVATMGVNAFGLHDMHGNLWEWTLDGDVIYTTEARAGDGLRKEPVGSAYRMIRGGCWNFTDRGARAAFRFYSEPSTRLNSVGFRPARGLR